MQKETGKKLRSLPGGAVGLFVAVDSGKCASAIFPFSWVVVWRIQHLQACTKRRKNYGGGGKIFIDVKTKIVAARLKGFGLGWGQPPRPVWVQGRKGPRGGGFALFPSPSQGGIRAR